VVDRRWDGGMNASENCFDAELDLNVGPRRGDKSYRAFVGH